MKRTTIKDVAAYLHYSVSTVSRALSDDRNVHPETKRRVLEAAEHLGYRRNHIASRLRTGRYGCIGVVVNEMFTPFASMVLEGIQSVIHNHGWQVLIVNSHGDSVRERRNLRLMEHSVIDGMIVCPCPVGDNTDEFSRIIEKGMPMVFFSRKLEGVRVPRVVVNDYDKAFFLTDHLVHAGLRRIVHLRGPRSVENFTEIHRGYRDALARHGIIEDDRLVIDVSLKQGEGCMAVRKMLESRMDFDAVFACNDLLAIEVMQTLQEQGMHIPEDVAVAGFSGSPLSQLVYPPLTTVEPCLFDMGEKAACLLLDIIKTGYTDRDASVIVDAGICLRASTHKK